MALATTGEPAARAALGVDTTLATNATAVASNDPFGGFTLGAAVLAVLVGGGYWYYRR